MMKSGIDQDALIDHSASAQREADPRQLRQAVHDATMRALQGRETEPGQYPKSSPR